MIRDSARALRLTLRALRTARTHLSAALWGQRPYQERQLREQLVRLSKEEREVIRALKQPYYPGAKP